MKSPFSQTSTLSRYPNGVRIKLKDVGHSMWCSKPLGHSIVAGRSVHERKYQGSSHVTTSEHDDMLVKE